MQEEPANSYLGVGEWIRRRRKALDLTQDELARQVGCSKVSISKIESEERRPSKQMAERLADVLGIAADDHPAFIRFARGDPRAALPARLAQGAMPVPWQTPVGNLPLTLTPLVGREGELAELNRYLHEPDIRLLTLTGPGGIGKTQLALQTASVVSASFAGGACFVPLAPLAADALIVSAVASALQFAFYGALEPKVQLLNYLKDKQILLIMDSFEHLLAGATLLTDMLAGAPKLKLLVTSRERLNLQSERVFEVQGLRVPKSIILHGASTFSAVQLFLQCARRIKPGFSLTEDEAPAVIRICQLVEGLPLGIEMAAAWVRALACREISTEIERNLEFLTTPHRDASERHRSLKAVFEYSWGLLTEAERQVLRGLSVWRGGFEREAAEKVTGAYLSILAALVDKSLVRQGASGRYDMHELLRQFAAEKLSESGETDAMHQRQRDWCLELAQLAQPPDDLWGTAEEVWLKRLEAERENLRVALDWSMRAGDAEKRLLLPKLLIWFWYLQASFSECRQWLEQALARSAGASPRTRADVLRGMGMMAAQLGDWEKATLFYNEALVLYRDLYPVETGWTLLDLGLIAVWQGTNETAAALFAESEALFQNGSKKASVVLYRGIAACYQRDFDLAKALLDQSLPILREVNDRLAIARALLASGVVARHQNDLLMATDHLSEGLTLAQLIGARLEIAEGLEDLAGIATQEARSEEAVRLFAAAEALREAIGTPLRPGTRADHDGDIATLHNLLAPGVYQAAYLAGRAMTMEQAIKQALEK